MTTGSNATCHVSRPRREGRRDGTARATCTCWIPVREADLRGCERVEIDGEYVLLIEYVRAGVSVSVARARRRECLARANALIEEHARARDSLVAIEPVIAGLTENGARRALLARIAAVVAASRGRTRARRISRRRSYCSATEGATRSSRSSRAAHWSLSASLGSRRGYS